MLDVQNLRAMRDRFFEAVAPGLKAFDELLRRRGWILEDVVLEFLLLLRNVVSVDLSENNEINIPNEEPWAQRVTLYERLREALGRSRRCRQTSSSGCCRSVDGQRRRDHHVDKVWHTSSALEIRMLSRRHANSSGASLHLDQASTVRSRVMWSSG